MCLFYISAEMVLDEGLSDIGLSKAGIFARDGVAALDLREGADPFNYDR